MVSPPDPAAPWAPAARTVLIVHQDDCFSSTLQCHLEEHGWTVSRTATGAHALRAWDELDPRLLIVELDAQDRDGFLLLDEVARRQDRPPVLVLSHDRAVESLSPEVRHSLGIDVAVSRPVRFATLTVLLELLFDQRWSTPPESRVDATRSTGEEPLCRAS